MPNGSTESEISTKDLWRPASTFTMGAVCLVVGLLVGYLLRGSAPAPSGSAAASTSVPQAMPAQTAGASGGEQKMPSLEEMKHMADTKAAPLLEKLKSEPNDAGLLIQIGDIYKMTHQFKPAADYYARSLELDPKNVGVRTDMASCLYYEGDVDGALAQLDKSLSYDPRHAGTLLNIGVIRWKGKGDVDGAVAAWKKLLRLYPNYERKSVVEHLIAEATKSKAGAQNGSKS